MIPVSLRRTLLRSLGLTWRSRNLVWILWLVGAFFAAFFASASGYWLSMALDGALATRGLLEDLDPNVIIELYHRDLAGFRILLLLGLFMVAIYTLLWCWFYGAVVAMIKARGRLSAGEAFRRGLTLGPVMFRLLCLSLSVVGAFTVALGLGAWWVLDSIAGGPSECAGYLVAALSGVIWAGAYTALTAVHDHARIRACAADEGSIHAYRWAVRFVLFGRQGAFVVALALHAVGLLLFVIYELVNMIVPLTGGWGVPLLLVWGQAFLLSRVALRVWFFAAQNELQLPV